MPSKTRFRPVFVIGEEELPSRRTFASFQGLDAYVEDALEHPDLFHPRYGDSPRLERIREREEICDRLALMDEAERLGIVVYVAEVGAELALV